MSTVDDPCATPPGPPSGWIVRWAHLIRPQGSVLDVACGHGRHLFYLRHQGLSVSGIDRSASAINAVAPLGEAVLADIESQPWPLMNHGRPRQFDAVVVTNYLWRPLFPVMAQSLAPGGVLLYETFSQGNETVGKPSRPDFLLQSGELLRAFGHLRLVAFEEGFLGDPDRYVQRIAAVQGQVAAGPSHPVARYPL